MDINVKALVGQIAAMFLVFALALFLPAGTIAWIPGILSRYVLWFCRSYHFMAV